MSIFELSIKRPVFISTILLAIIVFGVASYSRIGLDMFPNIEPPVATVLTIYPGAGPNTVEKEITEKIEDALSELSGIDQLRSISVENVSQVIVLYDLGVNADQAIQDVRDKVNRAAAFLPVDAETPIVEKMDLGAEPILTLTVTGPEHSKEITSAEVTEVANKRIKEPLQAVPGVGSITVIGGTEKEIKVWVDPLKLEAAGLAITDLIGVLRANNLEFPAGRITTNEKEFSIRIDGGIASTQDIADLPIMDIGGRQVRVKDVARVEYGVEERKSAAKSDGRETITLLVRKQSGTNSVATARHVKSRLAEIEKTLEKGWNVKVVADQTLITEASFNAVWFDMIFGGVLAVLIVFLFLRNFRSTFIAALALPLSVVGTFTALWVMGFTFNMLTMLALTLCIGILIDDAIVVIENIYRHLEEGKPPMQAALDGAKEIALAVFATTLCIAAVFLPALLSSGIMGIILKEFGLTVTVAVMISLFVSFTLTPMLSSRLLGEHKTNFFYRAIETFLNVIDRGYRRVIGFALAHRFFIIFIALSVFAGTIYSARYVNMTFLPSHDAGSLSVFVSLPPGTSMEKTEQVASNLADKIQKSIKEVTGTVVKVASDPQQTRHKAEIFVKLTDKQDRLITHLQLVDEVRNLLSDIEGAEIAVKAPNIIGGSGVMENAELQFNLKGNDLFELEETAKKIIRELERTRGFADVSMSYEGGKPEMQLAVDHGRAAGLGIPTAMVGQAVSALVGGADASKLRIGADEYNIRVRLDEQYRKNTAQLEGLKVRSTTTGRLVDVSSVARFEPRTGPTQIDRESRQRQITISANLTDNLSMSEAQKIVENAAARLGSKNITTGWSGMAMVLGKSVDDFVLTMILAVILIYMVLAAQFENWLHPLTIMMSLPLSVIGAIGGVLLGGGVMNIISMIGILMLMGLVTKNAILLVDYTNTLRRRDGLSRNEALLKAGPTRLRPILMTTMAMVFGMIPVAVSKGWGSELRAPMALPVIGGLVASTLLTLVVVPVVYTLVDSFGEAILSLFKRGSKAAPSAAATVLIVLSLPNVTSAQELQPKTTPTQVQGQQSLFQQPTTKIEIPPPRISEGSPITLSEALATAEERNLDLQTAKFEIDKVKANLKKAWAMVLPGIQAKLDYTHMDHADEVDLLSSMEPLFGPLFGTMGMELPPGSLDQPILINPRDKLTGSLQAQVPLINAEGWYTVKTAKKGIEVANLSIEQARRQILVGTAQAYYMALSCRDLIDFYHSQIETAQEQLRVAEARFRAGRGMRIDVIRAETDLKQASQSLLSAELAFDNARDALGQLIGAEGLPLPVTAPTLKVPKETEAEMEHKAIKSRVDIKTEEAKADLMKAQLKTAWMPFLPTLNLMLHGGYEFTTMAALGSQDRSRWAVMLSLTVPIYNHYRYGNLDEKRAQLKQIEYTINNTKNKAGLAVRKASRDYATALSSVVTAKQQTELAKEGLKLTEASYIAGTGDSLSVTNARQTYVASGFNLTTQELKAELALIALIDVLGDEIVDSIR